MGSRLQFQPTFYDSKDSYDKLNWQERRAEIKNSDGVAIFKKDVV